MKSLSRIEVEKFLSGNLKKWSFDGNCIKRDFKFKTFVEAFSFMTAVAIEAEKVNHHPNWSNVYNSVSINLNTHDVNGITKMDFDLANIIDKAFKNYK